MDISDTENYKNTLKKSKTIAFWYPPLILVICILIFVLVLLNFNYLPRAFLQQEEVNIFYFIHYRLVDFNGPFRDRTFQKVALCKKNSCMYILFIRIYFGSNCS